MNKMILKSISFMHTFASWLEWWFGRMKRMKINEMDKKKKEKKKSQTRKPELLFYDSFCFLRERNEFFMKMIEEVK